MKHKRDDGPEKQEDEAVDVTPVMICVFVVMCCSMLVLLYFFYDQLGGSPASALRAVCVGGGGCGPCLQGVPGGGGLPLPFLGARPPARGGAEPSLSPSLPPAPQLPPSLCHHWHLLPGLLHRPLQLLVTARAEAAVLQVQVSPRGGPHRLYSQGSHSATSRPLPSPFPTSEVPQLPQG